MSLEKNQPPSSVAVKLVDVELALGSGASRVNILQKLSLEVGRGESLGLVGASGSGKSTLLMVITGLERPDSGDVIIEGESLARLDENQLARFRGEKIGIVFQSFHLIPTMTALENVAVPLEIAGDSNALTRAREELVSVGLGERLHHYPLQLSGGEQQRVAIARALVSQPAILVADEPTGNLDGARGAEVADLLFDRANARGTTLILVTHDPALAARCKRTLHMQSGRFETAEAAE